MASAEFDEKSAEKRPAVQVGDPFMEKLLLEACLEVMDTDALVGMQDMGAAGLTCSTCEMGSRGGAGIEIDVSLVPQRETGMTPYEIMLSESQERMLLVVKQGREHEVEQIFEKWDPHAVRIGASPRTAASGEGPRKGRRGHSQPALTDEAPMYASSAGDPAYLGHAAGSRRRWTSRLRQPTRWNSLLSSPGYCEQAVGVPPVPTTWCAPTRSFCRAWARAWSASRARVVRWRSRSIATADTSTWTRLPGAHSRWPRPLGTSPAAGRCRSARPTA